MENDRTHDSTRPLPSGQSVAARTARAVADLLDDLAPRRSDYSGWEWIVVTNAGLLKIFISSSQVEQRNPQMISVFSRFHDPDAAVAILGKLRVNQFSGKWNWHFSCEDFEGHREYPIEQYIVNTIEKDLKEVGAI